MKKEIKFRAWNKETNQYELPLYRGVANLNINDILRGSTLIYQQFTGLLDKNRKEIYEGDIVRVIRDYLKERIKNLKIAVSEIMAEEKEGKRKSFSGGSTGYYKDYWFQHEHSITVSLAERVEKEILKLKTDEIREIKWIENNIIGCSECSNNVGVGYNCGSGEVFEVIGNIYENENKQIKKKNKK